MILDVAQAFAARQHGVVSRQQLLSAGIPGSTIGSSTEGGLLFGLFKGVYAVGRPQISREGLWMAAVLSAGEGAVLGFRSAAAAWGILDFRPSVEVLKVSGRGQRRAVINLDGHERSISAVIRKTRHLPPQHVSHIGLIPVTSVSRTLFDIASSEPDFRLKRAFIEADRNHLIQDEELSDCLAMGQGRPGANAFRCHVRERIPEMKLTRSVLEGLFLDLCRNESIRMPEVNVRLGRFEVDCLWRDERLVVELQGAEFHRGGAMLERDTLKANELRMAGWTVVHFTWRDVVHRSEGVARQVRRELEVGRSSPIRRSGEFEGPNVR